MGNFSKWEELCAARSAAQWEEDSACMALTARLAAFLNPTPSELERWRRACEKSHAINEQMRSHAAATSVRERSAARH
jgi:hypothetical protein